MLGLALCCFVCCAFLHSWLLSIWSEVSKSQE